MQVLEHSTLSNRTEAACGLKNVLPKPTGTDAGSVAMDLFNEIMKSSRLKNIQYH